MTFLDMQNLVLYYLDDLNAGYFTPVQTKAWLNNAQEYVQKLLIQGFEDLWVKSVQTFTVNGQREYNLPDDFRKLNRLAIVTSGNTAANESLRPLQFITRMQQDAFLTRTEIPQAFIFSNKQVWVYPLPNSQYVMRLDYTYFLPKMVNDNDVSEIPDIYQELVPICAVCDGLIKDGRDPGTLINKRNELIDALRKDCEQRNISSPRTIVVSGEDDGDWDY